MALRDASNCSAATTPVSKMMRGLGEVSLSKTPGSVGRTRALFVSKADLNQSQLNKRVALKRRDVTPSRNKNFNGLQGADRLIPNRRSSSQFELAYYHLTHGMVNGDTSMNTSSSAPCSPAKADDDRQKFMKMMRVKSASDLQSTDEEDRILVYRKNNAPMPPVGYMNSKVLYTTCVQPSSTVKKSSRFIPTSAERILDAPFFLDDYYTELLDWSSSGILAVALGTQLYLWCQDTGDINILYESDASNPQSTITSVKWANEGKFLAVGSDDGCIRLFDPSRGHQELRKIRSARVSRATCMSWREHLISVGFKSGQIVNNDVRIKESVVGVFDAHSQPVCGLHWSPENKMLASGGGDNIVNVWDDKQISTHTNTASLVLNEHTGSVKAVQFSNFKRGLLATGGGTNDLSVKLWNSADGSLIKSVDAGSQVTAIRFNKDYKEMIVALGRPAHQLKIYKHPTYSEVASIAGHTDRILGLAMSPCGQYVMSGSSDESLRLWHAFKVDKSTQRLQQRSKLTGMGSVR